MVSAQLASVWRSSYLTSLYRLGKAPNSDCRPALLVARYLPDGRRNDGVCPIDRIVPHATGKGAF